jgi:hypothetical protein
MLFVGSFGSVYEGRLGGSGVVGEGRLAVFVAVYLGRRALVFRYPGRHLVDAVEFVSPVATGRRDAGAALRAGRWLTIIRTALRRLLNREQNEEEYLWQKEVYPTVRCRGDAGRAVAKSQATRGPCMTPTAAPFHGSDAATLNRGASVLLFANGSAHELRVDWRCLSKGPRAEARTQRRPRRNRAHADAAAMCQAKAL